MKNVIKGSLVAALFVGVFAGPTITVATPALANEATLFVTGPGYVKNVYRDGFFDRYGVWHLWRDAREARDFQYRFRDRFIDEDHDIVGNRLDAYPAHTFRN